MFAPGASVSRWDFVHSAWRSYLGSQPKANNFISYGKTQDVESETSTIISITKSGNPIVYYSCFRFVLKPRLSPPWRKVRMSKHRAIPTTGSITRAPGIFGAGKNDAKEKLSNCSVTRVPSDSYRRKFRSLLLRPLLCVWRQSNAINPSLLVLSNCSSSLWRKREEKKYLFALLSLVNSDSAEMLHIDFSR